MRPLESERTGQKWVVVTGAGSGIGSALTDALLGRGYSVLGSAISEAERNVLLSRHPERFAPLLMDVRSEQSVAAAAAGAAATALGTQPLRGLFNIAGVISNGPLVDLSEATFGNILGTNLVGMHNTTRAFLPLLMRANGARVVNMSSASGTRTLPFTGAYSASKFGVEALSAAMRMEFAPLGGSVSAVAPGMIQTPMADKIQSDLQHEPSLSVYREPLRRLLAGATKAAERGIPMARIVSVLVCALEARNPRPRYEVHNNWLQDVVLARWLSVKTREALVCRALGLR